MSAFYHTFPTQQTQSRRLIGFGTAHSGPEWSTAVRALRAAISVAQVHAPYRLKPTGDEIAEALIDHIDQLSSRDRVVLAAILGILSARPTGILNPWPSLAIVWAAALLSQGNLTMRRPTDRAVIVVRTWIIPTIAAAFESYPELDVADVLDRCTAALTEKLLDEFADVQRPAAAGRSFTDE